MSSSTIAQTTEKLGQLARSRREAMGLSLRSAAPRAGVGVRFLSEFERGKPTVELGKVMRTLHMAGLDLAVVEHTDNKPSKGRAEFYSKLLKTEFPYDWSNRQMDDSVFILKVLEMCRFNDVLKVVAYFGFDRASSELPYLKNRAQTNKVISMLSRIQKGKLMASCQSHDAAS